VKVFDLDPAALRATFEEQGWLHVRSGLAPEFLAFAQEHVARLAAETDPLTGAAVTGAKEQFVLPFPEGTDVRAQVHDVIAALTGLDPARTVLSERHVKAYLPDADPAPLAHKDRFASQISVGLTLRVGEGSHVVLWPRDETAVNPHLTTGLRDSLLPEQAPEVLLDDTTAVMLHDAPGDVLVFHGSRTWHLRRHSASTTLVYLKFNDFGSDPLAEDPTTPQRRRRTLDLLASGDLASCSVELARGFDCVAQEHGWQPGRRTWSASVWADGVRSTRSLPEAWVALVDRAGDGAALAAWCQEGTGELSGDAVVSGVRELAARGVLDLVPPQA
jgi:hypothetical protein